MGAVTAPGMRQQWAARTGGEMKLFGRCAIIESCFVTHACIPQALHPSATSHRTTNIVPAKLLCARRLNSIPSKYARRPTQLITMLIPPSVLSFPLLSIPIDRTAKILSE